MCQLTINIHSVANRNSPTVKTVFAMIVVVDRRERTFRVNCTSTGGRALNMPVTGPGASFLSSIQAVGDPQGIGNDMFSVSTNGRLDGDAYLCRASNGVSPDLNNNIELRGSY